MLGKAVGSSLGMNDGETLGMSLGTKLGELLGELLGTSLGTSLGENVGKAEGDHVGELEGIAWSRRSLEWYSVAYVVVKSISSSLSTRTAAASVFAATMVEACTCAAVLINKKICNTCLWILIVVRCSVFISWFHREVMLLSVSVQCYSNEEQIWFQC